LHSETFNFESIGKDAVTRAVLLVDAPIERETPKSPSKTNKQKTKKKKETENRSYQELRRNSQVSGHDEQRFQYDEIFCN
jgi:hypothetical protein